MKKILIIRFSSIGDIVLTTPVIRCVKNQLPDAEVHFLTKTAFADVVNSNPYIDRVWTFDSDLDGLISELKKENFDFVADLHHNIRSMRVSSALGVKLAAFRKLNIEKWMLVNLKINLLPEKHIVNRYMETVAFAGVKYDGKGLDYFIASNDDVNTADLPAPWNNGYIGFIIGAKHATKRFPVMKIISLINEMKLPVILLGGKEDNAAAAEIVNNTGGHTFNGCGVYRLGQSASLVKQARFIITNDTGLMHIAAAFHQRIISIWGNTVPEFGMIPYLPIGEGESLIIENKNLSCRPCSKIGYEKCPRGHFRCMLDLDTKAIITQGITWWQHIAGV